MSQLREGLGDRENNLDPDAALKEQVRRLPRKAGSSGPSIDRAEQKPNLDTLDDLAEIVRQRKDEVLKIDPDSPEYDRALYRYNRDAEGYLHHATRVTKLEKKGVKGYEKLSTGQISQAKEEYQAILNLTAIETCLSDRDGQDEQYSSCSNPMLVRS